MSDATILPFAKPNRRREPRELLGGMLLRERARLASQPAAFRAAVNSLAGAGPAVAAAVDLAPLRALRATLFVAPGREPEMHRIWRETLATAVLASLIAAPLRLDRCVMAGAALLHRLDEMLFVAAVAHAETTTPLRLRGPALRRAYSERDAVLEGLLDGWDLDPRIVPAVRNWRSCLDLGEDDDGFTASRGVYFAHLLAMTRLYPEEGAPGIVELAARELGVPDAVAQTVGDAAHWLSRTFRTLSGV